MSKRGYINNIKVWSNREWLYKSVRLVSRETN